MLVIYALHLSFAAQKNPRKIILPDPPHIVDIRSDILKILLEIDRYASRQPHQKISIRNRTRESITRHLHYEKDESKLTRMRSDADRLLELWKCSN